MTEDLICAMEVVDDQAVAGNVDKVEEEEDVGTILAITRLGSQYLPEQLQHLDLCLHLLHDLPAQRKPQRRLSNYPILPQSQTQLHSTISS